MYHLKKLLATTLFLKQNVKIVLDSFINFFTQYLDYWPLACAVMLLFAGINIPVSEDAMIILSAGIAANDRTMIVPNWIGLFVGIFVSDRFHIFHQSLFCRCFVIPKGKCVF